MNSCNISNSRILKRREEKGKKKRNSGSERTINQDGGEEKGRDDVSLGSLLEVANACAHRSGYLRLDLLLRLRRPHVCLHGRSHLPARSPSQGRTRAENERQNNDEREIAVGKVALNPIPSATLKTRLRSGGTRVKKFGAHDSIDLGINRRGGSAL